MYEVNDMDKRDFKNFITKRSSIWTLSLCMTGIIVLGGIAAVDKGRRADEAQRETEIGQIAYLEEEIGDRDDIEESLFPTLDEPEELAQASGSTVKEDTETASGILKEDQKQAEENTVKETESSVSAGDADENAEAAEEVLEEAAADVSYSEDELSEEASSGEIISQQELLEQGIAFSNEEALMWPSAGTILIDYSMDGSVYFPTLNQYKYNPALIIGSETGNQVLASAKGIVESISIDEETGNTVVLNIGNGYKLTYGQLKEIAVSQGSVVEEGALLGYVSEPTKYYSEEGSNLYFAMTQDGKAVDPVLYLE